MCKWLYVVLFGLLATSAHAQTVTPHDDQTVTIRAEGVAIATLLADIARVYPLERVTILPGVEQRPVSIVLEHVPPSAGLVGILKASGLDFAVSGRRVIVGEWKGPAEAKASALRTVPEALLPKSDAERQAEELAAAAAEQQAISDASGTESDILPTLPVRFIANGENITYLEPNFVPYKMRPEVRARRMATDVAKIP